MLQQRGRRILLVDDDEPFRYATRKMLSEAGFRVVAACDFRHALEVITGSEPLDLLLTDVAMPNRVNGFARAHTATTRRRGMSVMHMTAFDVPTHEAIGKVLRKPISTDELIAEVSQAIAA